MRNQNNRTERKGSRDSIRVLLIGIMLSFVLCGCTRREQLVLEAGFAEEEVSAEEPGTSVSQTGGGLDSTAQSGQQMASPGSAGQGNAGVMAEDLGQMLQENAGSDDGERSGQVQRTAPEEAASICVHVCGAVKRAGVYELPAGSRVFEAVQEAGGFAEDADESYVNQAQRLTDGAKLVIPTVEQVREEGGGEDSAAQIGIVEQVAERPGEYGVQQRAGSDAETPGPAEDGKVNINTASEAQLCEIPGIGATRAAAIVAYRQESGGFQSIEDIMNVSGIKEGTYAKIKDSIKVN